MGNAIFSHSFFIFFMKKRLNKFFNVLKYIQKKRGGIIFCGL